MKTAIAILSAIVLPSLIPIPAFSQGKCISGDCTRGYGIYLMESGLKQEGYFDSKGLGRGWTKVQHANDHWELTQTWNGKRKGIRLYHFKDGTVSMFLMNDFNHTTKIFQFEPDDDTVYLYVEDQNGKNKSSKRLYGSEKYMAKFVRALNEEFVQLGKTTYGWFDISLGEAELIYNKMWGSKIWQYRISLFDLTLSARNHPEGNPGGDVYSIMCNRGLDHVCIEHYRESNNRLLKNDAYASFQFFGPRYIDNDQWVTPLKKAKKLAKER